MGVYNSFDSYNFIARYKKPFFFFDKFDRELIRYKKLLIN